MPHVLEALKGLGGSAAYRELDAKVISALQLTPAQLEESLPDGRTMIAFELAWARTLLKKAGQIESSSRGIWTLMPGSAVPGSAVPESPAQSDISPKGRGRKNQTVTQAEPSDEDQLPDVNWRTHLLETLKNLPPDAFERLCQLVLRESGFVQVRVTGKSGDGGIDGVGVVQVGGLISFPIVFQCKRYRNVVDAATIRNFRGAMSGRADRGLVMTTGTFSQPAWQEATRDGVPPVDLIDGEALAQKLKELRLGIKVELVESVEIQTEWFGRL